MLLLLLRNRAAVQPPIVITPDQPTGGSIGLILKAKRERSTAEIRLERERLGIVAPEKKLTEAKKAIVRQAAKTIRQSPKDLTRPVDMVHVLQALAQQAGQDYERAQYEMLRRELARQAEEEQALAQALEMAQTEQAIQQAMEEERERLQTLAAEIAEAERQFRARQAAVVSALWAFVNR
ncbi:MAG: hypothetical protein RJA99_3143 [Pseudomonadota bacterium]|jgi:predicted RNA-binding protein YlxR (DUF448 family)